MSSTRRHCTINCSMPRSRSRAPNSPIKTPRPPEKSPRSRWTEFIERTFKHELNAVKGEVALAQSAIQKAESRLDRARRARQRLGDMLRPKKGAVAASDILAELDVEDRVDASEQTISREKAALELAKSKQDFSRSTRKDKTIKALTTRRRAKADRRACQEKRAGSSSRARRKAREANRRMHDHGARRRHCRVRQSPTPQRNPGLRHKSRKARGSAKGR